MCTPTSRLPVSLLLLTAASFFAISVGAACSNKDGGRGDEALADDLLVLTRLNVDGTKAPMGAATPAVGGTTGAVAEAPPALELKPIRDGKGQVGWYLPLPRDWEVAPTTGAKYTITAPGGVKVNETESASYVWSNDAQMRQTLTRSDKPIVAPLPLERIIKEGIEPEARAHGFSLDKSYELPRLKAFWDAFSAAMPNTGTRRTYRVMGTDWSGQAGERAFIVITQIVFENGKMVTWSVHTTELEAPGPAFEMAKKTYIDGLAYAQVDESWQRSQGMQLSTALRANQEEAQRWMRIGAERHRRAMADIDAAGRTALAIGKTNSEILDKSHEGFRNRSNMNSAGQAKTVNAILEQTVVVNPQSGTRFKVQSGYKYYWGNGNNGYIGSNNPNFDPRLDPTLNQQQWFKFGPGAGP